MLENRQEGLNVCVLRLFEVSVNSVKKDFATNSETSTTAPSADEVVYQVSYPHMRIASFMPYGFHKGSTQNTESK